MLCKMVFMFFFPRNLEAEIWWTRKQKVDSGQSVKDYKKLNLFQSLLFLNSNVGTWEWKRIAGSKSCDLSWFLGGQRSSEIGVCKCSNQKKGTNLQVLLGCHFLEFSNPIKGSIYKCICSISPLSIHNSGNTKPPTNCYSFFFWEWVLLRNPCSQMIQGFSRRARLWREFWWIASLQMLEGGDFFPCDKKSCDFCKNIGCFF